MDAQLTKVSLSEKALVSRRSWEALKLHWPEYLIEGFGLGLFMILACLFGIVIEHPSSPIRRAIEDATLRRVLFGGAMGVVAVLNIYSPWGQRSGAHFNPATTLTFWRLGKVETWDAIFYSLSQFAGAILGVLSMSFIFGGLIAHPAVNFVTTVPGENGVAAAFAAEIVMTFVLILAVLLVSNNTNLARYTGLIAGGLVWVFIVLEAPISGMSLNPARTLGSAIPSEIWTAIWIYFTAPPIGMLLGAQLFVMVQGRAGVHCAKLNHFNDKRCIFRCNFKGD